jgi:hypothetical protein
MTKINVDTDEIDRLIDQQTTAAEKLGDVSKAAAKLGWNTGLTHGPICTHTVLAAIKAEPARLAAGVAMKKVSDDLAELLVKAKADYEGTDEGSKDALDKEMGDR